MFANELTRPRAEDRTTVRGVEQGEGVAEGGVEPVAMASWAWISSCSSEATGTLGALEPPPDEARCCTRDK